MSGMFGAPIGISAAEQDQRSNILGALQGMEALGRIEQRPAQTRLINAQAAAAEGELEEKRQLAELASNTAKARAAAAQGHTLTVDNLRPQPTSLASPLLDMLAMGEKRGVSPGTLAPLAKQAAEIQHKEAQTASARAEEVKRNLDAQAKQLDLYGSFAMAGLQGPQQYAQARMQMEAAGIPTGKLPADWRAAVPMLRGIVTSSLKAKEAIELDMKKEQDAAQRARWGSANARDAEAVKTAQARTKLLKERTSVLHKNGGSGSKEETEAQKELRLARKAEREAKERKEFPAAPLDPEAREPGKTYTAANGVRFTWMMDPETGKGVGVPLPGVAKGVPGLSLRADDEDEDDALSEEDEE